MLLLSAGAVLLFLMVLDATVHINSQRPLVNFKCFIFSSVVRDAGGVGAIILHWNLFDYPTIKSNTIQYSICCTESIKSAPDFYQVNQ